MHCRNYKKKIKTSKYAKLLFKYLIKQIPLQSLIFIKNSEYDLNIKIFYSIYVCYYLSHNLFFTYYMSIKF